MLDEEPFFWCEEKSYGSHAVAPGLQSLSVAQAFFPVKYRCNEGTKAVKERGLCTAAVKSKVN